MNPESQVTTRGGQLQRVTSPYGIPEGAVPLDRQEVLKVQWTTIRNWKPRSEMWPFIHGASLLASFSALSGAVCNMYFREKFNVQKFGRASTFVPIIVIPAALSMITHQLWVSNTILVDEFSCPLCGQVRAGTIQAILGAVYPCTLAAPLAIVLARRNWTYPVPTITEHRQVLSMLSKTGRPFQLPFLVIFMGQFVMGMAMAKQQQRVFNEKLSAGMLPRDPNDIDRS
ncbi:uncharacterized protein LOC135479467 [Liolophura sinensis]|uniref:uncharacterized protein LOC135479467 n=1 Tax=Liolophura sinensis TaxID=3198878 RepID=UPI0031598F61